MGMGILHRPASGFSRLSHPFAISSIIAFVVILSGCFTGVRQEENLPSTPVSSTLNQPGVSTPTAEALVDRIAQKLRDIPQYPGSEEYKIEAMSTPSPSLSFLTKDDYKDIMSFYKRTLPGIGWTIINEASDSALLGAEWHSRAADKMPTTVDTNYELHIVASEAQGAHQLVRMVLQPWPNPAIQPIAPGATSVETTFELIETDLWARKTSYFTKGSIAVVEKFYRETLSQQGWKLDGSSTSISSKEGLLFTSFRPKSDALGMNGGYIRVNAEELPQGGTHITLRMVFDGLRP